MHFSASIAQLVATLIMTLLRVIIRRHISQEPEIRNPTSESAQTAPADPQGPGPTLASGLMAQGKKLFEKKVKKHQVSQRYAVQDLTDGHELDIIAMQLHKCKSWQVVAFRGPEQDTGLSQHIPAGVLAEKLAENVLQTRIRLTELLQSSWRTRISEQAKVLSGAMAAVMNSLWNSDGVSGSMPKLRAESAGFTKLSWEIPVETQSTDCTSSSSESIKLSLRRKQLAGDRGPWEADVARVEAVLQLWMLQLGKKYTGGDANVVWLLCPDDDYAAIMVADWWIGKEAGSVNDKTLEDIREAARLSSFAEGHEGPSVGVDIKECIIGSIGQHPDTPLSKPMPRPAVNKGSQIKRGVIQHMELGAFATQYILYTFLSQLVQSIEDITIPKVVGDEQATGPLLRNDTIMNLALKVHEHGLCTLGEAYRVLVCALAGNGKLPILYQQSTDTESFLVLYQTTLQLAHKYGSKGDKGSPAALRAEKIYKGALRLCRMKSLELIDQGRWMDAGKLVVRAARISECVFTDRGELMREVRDLMLLVASKFVSQPPSPSEGPTTAACADARDVMPAHGTLGPPPSSIHEPGSNSSKLITAVRLKDASEVQKLLEARNDNGRDPPMDKARALDYAAQRGNQEILILLHLYGILPSHAHAPLWWAVSSMCTRTQGSSGRDFSGPGIEANCVEVLKLLLDFGHDPNKLEPTEKESPLHLAAKSNLMNAMGTLLGKEEALSTRILASVDLEDRHGLNPLYYAVKEGHDAMTNLLLNHGADITCETGPGKQSPMHHAALHGDLAVLEYFHEKRDDIEAFDAEGKSLLYYAVKGGSNELLKALLGMGADLNRKCPRSQGGRTALHWIALEGNAVAIRTLLEKDAGLTNESDENGRTALHYAVKEGQRAAVYVLLEKGAAIDKRDIAGATPLMYAKHLLQGGVAKDIIWMLDHASDMKLDDKNQTALSRAAFKGDGPTVETLLRCGPGVEVNGAQSDDLWTPLHLAAEGGHERVVQMLLDNGAVASKPNSMLLTPLHCAAQKGHEQIAKMLLDNGAVVSPRDNALWTPLHYAAVKGHTGVIRALLDKGAEIEAKAATGYTPLHIAAMYQRPQAIRILVDNGADLHATDGQGNTPEFYATHPSEDVAINLEVAEVFRNLRNRTAETITTDEGKGAQGAIMGGNSVMTGVELAEGVDTGLPVEQLVQQTGARQ